MNTQPKETWTNKQAVPSYQTLRAVNVSDKLEKKNGLSYLSWPFAVDTLLQHDSAATWSYGPIQTFGDTLMVQCTVAAFGKEMTAQLPVMDHRNKAIPNPDAFAVNTAMQRCLVKAIALHGLGLYIYAGEDLPGGEPEAPGAAQASTHADVAGELGKDVPVDQARAHAVKMIAIVVKAAADGDHDELKKACEALDYHEKYLAADQDLYYAASQQMDKAKQNIWKNLIAKARAAEKADRASAPTAGRRF